MKSRIVLVRIVLGRRPNPWDCRTDEIFEKHQPQSGLERVLYRGHAASEWMALQGNGTAQAVHEFWNDKILAAGYQGALYEDASRHLESLTGRSSSWAARKNVLWWTPVSLATEHLGTVLAVFGAEKAAFGHGELAAVPLAYAGVFAGYNYLYRLPQARSGRALPNIGYFALGANFKEMVHQNAQGVYDTYNWRARRDCTSLWYAGLQTVIEDVATLFTRKNKQVS